jgi:hypothetical protein
MNFRLQSTCDLYNRPEFEVPYQIRSSYQWTLNNVAVLCIELYSCKIAGNACACCFDYLRASHQSYSKCAGSDTVVEMSLS